MEIDCSNKCRSKQHSNEMITAVTKGSFKQTKAYLFRCPNSLTLTNKIGLSVGLMAASCGKLELLQWILELGKLDLKLKDHESGWTMLHRALFYGHFNVARFLVAQPSINLYCLDKEGLTPLDIVTRDRPSYVSLNKADLTECFSWGNNSNFTLGHNNEISRTYPEVIDTFRQYHVSVVEVVTEKFHSVFLSSDGKVYTCGHGQGGRLGHGNEQTLLVPKVIKSLQHERCIAIAASRDHTVILTESKLVYTCGMNESHQLGHLPPPRVLLVPKQVKFKMLKDPIIGISSGKFHTVFYTKTALYTCGLNAGQLGHQKGDKFISQPRLVSALNHRNMSIFQVVCSNAATVCLTTDNNIYVLHQYSCMKVVTKFCISGDICKVVVNGGHLDHSLDFDILRERGGTELVIMLLDSAYNKVFVWRKTNRNLCRLKLKRSLYITDITIHDNGFALTTSDGEAFSGTLQKKKKPYSPAVKGQVDSSEKFPSLLDLLYKEEVEEANLTRIQGIYRAVRIYCDQKGWNYIATQVLPNLCLTLIPEQSGSLIQKNFEDLIDEASECDMLHDIIIEVENNRIPAHKYILASQCLFFQCVLVDETGAKGNICFLTVDNISVVIFREVLKFLYTDSCDLLKPGSIYRSKHDLQSGKKSAKSQTRDNPLSLLKDAAKQLGIPSLKKRLDALKFQDGLVESSGKSLPAPRVRFDRKRLPELYDVCISCEDGVIIHCHKCILCGRLEYFNSMLGCSWKESSGDEVLNLPIPSKVLQIIIHYLYTDDFSGSLQINNNSNTELLCNVLVVADQLLIPRLKEKCEIFLTSAISLKNAAELLEFSYVYNAHQLKLALQEYICINMAPLLETRSLDILSDEVLEELTRFYKTWVPAMCRRHITPWGDVPDIHTLETCEKLLTEDEELSTYKTPTKEESSKKRRRRQSRSKSISEDKPVNCEILTAGNKQQANPSNISTDDIKNLCEDFSTSCLDSSCDVKSPSDIMADCQWLSKSPLNAPDVIVKSPLSFTDIIVEESNKSKSTSNAPIMRTKGKNKISQKERKRQLFQQINVSPPSLDIVTPKSLCPWANTIPSPTSPDSDISLRNVMQDEFFRSNPPMNGPGGDTSSFGHLLKKPSQRARKLSNTLKMEVKSPTESPTENITQNPWKSVNIVAPLEAASCEPKFVDIVNKEMTLKQNHDRNINKPLRLIQIEERAMQELLLQYKADEKPGEIITVERVSLSMASPTWPATQRRH